MNIINLEGGSAEPPKPPLATALRGVGEGVQGGGGGQLPLHS